MFQKLFTFLCVISLSITLFSCEESKDDDTSLLVLLYSLVNGNAGANVPTSCKDSAFCRTFLATNNGTGYNGNLGGISGADAKCTAAKPAGLNGTYKALLVSGNVREVVSVADGSPGLKDWVLYPNKQYRRSDGTTITFTTNSNSIVVDTLQNGIDAGAQKFFWNGFNGGPGTFPWEVSSDCNAWSSGDGIPSGQAGNTTATNPNETPGGAFTIDGWNCNQNLNLLCVEQ
ncbi:DUF1554 domain-containing protein [Leptospira sp. 201903071]|uniref:endostatin-like outer membrane protein, LenA/LenB family n=1 Tax=Leptospira ainazelensis TaxID=2810034 RepID=UPI00196659B6|nr:DUF1554 domain-containing protein [Leptospira ainazelensis]MBM9500447.1 DUF1554 domain-containing protein [Leptospira ainazelensis]